MDGHGRRVGISPWPRSSLAALAFSGLSTVAHSQGAPPEAPSQGTPGSVSSLMQDDKQWPMAARTTRTHVLAI